MQELILSNDVRAYIKKTGHKFTDFELAALICNAGWSLSETQKALLEIAGRTSDLQLKKQIEEHIEWDFTCMEKIKEDKDNCVYKLEIWYEEDNEYEDELYFSSYSLLKRFVDTCHRKTRIIKIKLCKNEIKWDEDEVFCNDIANIFFDKQGNPTDYWIKNEEQKFSEKRGNLRFEDAYVYIPHPFEEGDIVRIVGTDEVGIVRLPAGLDKEAEKRKMLELAKKNCVDYTDACIAVEIIGKNSEFEHEHIIPQMLEYIELTDSDLRKPPLEYARKLIQGKCFIQEFQMACEGRL